MTILQALILGIVQGATEFIPVSSSGHLVLVPYLMGWNFSSKESFIFDVLAQVATLFAVIIYFRRDLAGIFKSALRGIRRRDPFKDKESKLGWLLLLSTIPACVTALLFKDLFERAFSSPKSSAIFLYGTAFLLFISELWESRMRSLEEITWADSLVIGIFQIFALFPGVSRSGTTISGGMIRGFRRDSAARFSFLMSVPILFASGVLATVDLLTLPNLVSRIPVYMVGFVTAALVGYFVIRWLLNYLSSRSLVPFGMYCFMMASIVLGVIVS